MIADAIEHGLAQANYQADLASKRRALSAWGTVERKGAAWSWRWSGLGLALPQLLPAPLACVSAEAAWVELEVMVRKVLENVRRIGAGG